MSGTYIETPEADLGTINERGRFIADSFAFDNYYNKKSPAYKLQIFKSKTLVNVWKVEGGVIIKWRRYTGRCAKKANKQKW